MDEVDELREQLAEARADAERLAERLADREAEVLHQSSGVGALRQELEAARQEAIRARAAAAEESRALAMRYRVALVESAPDVPPDLIQGESADDLDHSLATARAVVAQVKAQAHTAASARIPVGSPVRGGAPRAALSPAEMIRAGIAEGR